MDRRELLTDAATAEDDGEGHALAATPVSSPGEAGRKPP
jgi:hypothetical protein